MRTGCGSPNAPRFPAASVKAKRARKHSLTSKKRSRFASKCVPSAACLRQWRLSRAYENCEYRAGDHHEKRQTGSVILPIKEYQEMLERLEDAEDVAWLK